MKWGGIALVTAAVVSLGAGAHGRPRRHAAAKATHSPGINVRVEERSSGLVYVVQLDDDPPPLVGATGVNGTIIPLYTRPSDASWAAVASAKRAHPAVPAIAIINPADGPGVAALADYAAGTSMLTGAGLKVIGYVHTEYGHRDPSAVEQEIDRYRSWYPAVTGIFFDEMANTTGYEAYYRALDAYAKSRGHDLTVGNPGTELPRSYLGSADVFIIREGGGLPAASILNGAGLVPRATLGALCYGVPAVDGAFVAAVRRQVGYIYLQSDTLPNPWDTVPSYLAELLAALE
jgi:hypothetical protein